MCCCYVEHCCCGCTSMKAGIMIMAGIDALYQLGIGAAISAMWGSPGNPFAFAFLVLLSDILLLFGAAFNQSCLIIFWQVVMMINIILLFLGWLLLPLIYFVVVLHSAALSACNHVQVVEFDSYNQTYQHCDGLASIFAASTAILIGVIIYIYVMPIYYIYFWIVVQSFRKGPPPTPVAPVAPVAAPPAMINISYDQHNHHAPTMAYPPPPESQVAPPGYIK